MFPQAPMTRFISLALLLLGLSGCSSWHFSTFQDPAIHLLKVQVVKARLVQQEFNLHFILDNPNDSRLLVRGFRYKVMLNDVLLAEDSSSDWFFVAARSRKTFVVPVRTNLWRHVRYIAQLLKDPEDEVRYRLEGRLKTGLIFRHSTHIERSETIKPRELLLKNG
ncbi:LEA type 2 family protein [Pseudomonas sp. NPDC089734]|uniref:LEA type 2 family protein n=1 Tax=Pseudomonas sp. NPDC089734 TaxID=3364469 RepID=UPI003824575F